MMRMRVSWVRCCFMVLLLVVVGEGYVVDVGWFG